MRNRRWSITFLAAMGLCAPILPGLTVVTAKPAARSPELEQEVRQLLSDLASDTRSRRVAAEKRLIELGPGVLALLPAPELLPSVSVREAVRRIRFELERAGARESVLPSRVTVQGKMSIGE